MSFTSCILTLPDDGGEDNPQPTPTQERITIPSTVDVKPVVSPEGGDTKITFTAAADWTASGMARTNYNYRYQGFSVRPVSD